MYEMFIMKMSALLSYTLEIAVEKIMLVSDDVLLHS